MPAKNRSVPVDTVLPHVIYQNLEEAIAWLTRAFGFQEYYRYGDGPRGGQMWAGKAAIQVNQADEGQRSPAQLGYGTQSLTVFVNDVDAHYAPRGVGCGAKTAETLAGRQKLSHLAHYRAGDTNDATLRPGGSCTRIGELNIELF